MAAESFDLWKHMRVLDLARRLRADLDNLADTSPEIAEAMPGVAVYLAALLDEGHPKAAGILRGERRRPLRERLEAEQGRRATG